MSVIISQESQERVMLYRRVFGTDEGRQVLEDILLDLGHFSVSESDDDIVRQNYAKSLLYKVGAYVDRNIPEMVESYLTMPYLDPVEET